MGRRIFSMFFLMFLIGIGIFCGNKHNCNAAEVEIGKVDSIGSYNSELNHYSNVGIKISVNDIVKYYALDTWINDKNLWNYVGSNVNENLGSYKSYMYNSYKIWLRDPEDATNRFMILNSGITELTDYSVVLRRYRFGKLYSTDVEYSFQDLSQSSLGDLSLFHRDIQTGTYSANGVSYIYDIYSPIEIQCNGVLQANANNGTIQKSGKAYKTGDGYYLYSLPTASMVKAGYKTSFLGWYSEISGGRKYEVGDILPEGTILYAHWKEEPLPYQVKCIDILGEDISGQELGTSTWTECFGTNTSGSIAGTDTTAGAYYTGCIYKGCSSALVGVSGTTVYRYFCHEMYDVQYIDQIESGSRKGEILKNTIIKKEYSSLVKGSELGDDSNAGAYYKGYCFSRSTIDAVSTNGAVVYRYFKPVEYSIIFNGNGATSGSMMCIAECKYDDIINLTKNCFIKENKISFHLNGENAVCSTSEIYVSQKFLGWSLNKNGSVRYSDGMSCSNIIAEDGTVTLYAIWSDEKVNIADVPKRLGYQFAGWSETADASTGKTQFNLNSDMELFAIWKSDIVKYQVEYYKENLMGSYELVSSYQLDGYTNSTVKIDTETDIYQGFTLDEESSKLSGTVCEDSSLILSAFFRRNSYSFSYDLNGGTQNGNSIDKEIVLKRYGVEILLPTQKLIRDGYIFQGWSQEPNGNHTIYDPGDKYTMQNHDVVLYAVWSPIEYSILFDANAALEEVQGSMCDLQLSFGKKELLYDCEYVRNGYEFLSWNTKADGSGKTYEAGEMIENLTCVADEKIRLYAQWKPISFLITYDKNDTSDLMSTISGVVPNTEYYFDLDSYASDITFKAIGYELEAWNTKADGSGISFKPGENIKGQLGTKEQNILYAQWKPNSHTGFKLHLYLEGIDDAENDILLDDIELYGCTGEKISDAIKRIYEKTLEEEEAKYFYAGYEVKNLEALEQVIKCDSSTEVILKLIKREYILSYEIYKDEQSYQIATDSAIYSEELVLPEKISNIKVAQYIDSEGNCYNPGDTITMNKNRKVFLQQSIEFYGNSEQFSDITTLVIYGKQIRLPNIEKNGYEFLGWYTEGGEFIGNIGQVTNNILKNSKFYAKWSEPLSYHIFYDIDDLKIKVLENKISSYHFMEKASLPDISQIAVAENYKFIGWYFSDDPDKNIITEIAMGEYGDKRIKALLVKNTEQSIKDIDENIDTNDKNKNNVQNQVQSSLDILNNNQNLKNSSQNINNNLGVNFKKGKFKYKVIADSTKKKYVKLLAINSTAKCIIIPDKVIYKNITYYVRSIGKRAFYKKNKIESVIIPDSVTSIKKYAFANMKNLKKITIGKKVQQIGKGAFMRNKKLKKVVIRSKKVKEIKKKAFYQINKNIKFLIPRSRMNKYQKLIQQSNVGNKFKIIHL